MTEAVASAAANRAMSNRILGGRSSSGIKGVAQMVDLWVEEELIWSREDVG